ncbi:EAL domain-containing protein [Oxalobacter paraformigenes]|nr:EAL domain-containing protein [Oxalobacter paraformigenes]
MSIGKTALFFAVGTSFYILCTIYFLSLLSEEILLKFHLFGIVGFVFVIFSTLLLHFLLAKSELAGFLSHRRAIVFTYLFLTSLYFLVADIFVYHNPENSGTLLEFTLKTNLALAGISSCFLYLFLWHFDESRSLKAEKPNLWRKTGDYRLAAIFLGLLLIIPLISFGLPKLYSSHLEKETLANLQAKVQAKAQHIESWLKEQREIGSVVLSSAFFRQSFEKWRFDNSLIAKMDVVDFLKTLKNAQQYKSIKIIDPKGNELLSLGENLRLEEDNRLALLELMNRPHVRKIRHNIYSQGKSGFEMVIPYILTDRTQEAMGAVLIAYDPEDYFSQHFDSWIASHPGREVVLRRQVGDKAIMLTIKSSENGNSAVHTTLKNHEIVSPLPAGSDTGHGIGNDYNQTKVFAAWNNIDDTDWKLIFKYDYNKAIRSMQNSAFGVAIITFFAVLVIGLALLLIWKMHQKTQNLARKIRKDKLQDNFYTMPFIGMAILSPRMDCWLQCNDKICDILGYTKEEMTLKSWQDICFRPDTEEERSQLIALKEGVSEEIHTERELICKNGDVVLVDMHARCVRNRDKSPDYFVVTFEDITRQRQSERQVSRLSQLNTIRSHCSYAIARSKTEIELFENICRIVVHHSNVKMAWIGLIDEPTGMVKTGAKYGDGVAFLEEIVISVDENHPNGHGTVGRAVRSGKPCWNQDFQQDPLCAPWHKRSIRNHVQSVASLPLHKNGKITGVFLLASERTDAFDPSVQNLLVEIANDIDFSLENFHREHIRSKAENELRNLYVESKVAEAEIRRLNQLYAILGYCNQAVARCSTQDELFRQICRIVTQYGAMKVAWIGLVNEENKVYPVASEGASPAAIIQAMDVISRTDLTMTQGIIRKALKEDKPVWVQDFDSDPICDILRNSTIWKDVTKENQIHAIACLPLHKNGKTIGVLSLNAAETYAFDIAAQKLLKELVTSIDFALDNFDRKQQLQLSAQIFTQSNEGLMLLDSACHIVMVNKAFTTITGYSDTEALGHNPRILSSGRHDRDFYENMWNRIDKHGSWQGEIWNRRKDGTFYPEWLSIQTMRDSFGKLTHYIGLFADMTERKKTEEKVQWLAHFDALTGLPNRTLLRDRSNLAISLAQRRHEPLALMFLDLDGFKNVNDSLGHNTGDELLKQFASRLKSVVREQDTVSRQGGDEFVLVLPNTDTGGATSIAEKLLAIAAEPYHIEPHELNLTASIGIAMYPADGIDFDTLSCSADTAMYRTKQGGRNNYCFFTTEMQARSARMLELDSALRRALEREQFTLHYQPIMSLKHHIIVGFEALLRWEHPQLGPVSPEEFIPVAESNGQIIPIGEWILRSVISQLRKWIDAGHEEIMVSVNLSAIQFRDRRLSDMVSTLLKEAQVSPDRLVLELTEGVAMEKPDAAIVVVDSLKERGVKVSVDDFGTGYSSLAYLKRFSAHSLKIDGSFIRNIPDDTENMAIVSAIVSLAKNLGIKTIAEGVETEEHIAFLTEIGCTAIQGHYLSRPMTADAASDFLNAALANRTMKFS